MKKDDKIVWKKVDNLRPDPQQPRKSFDLEKLKLQAETMKSQGVISEIEIDKNNTIVTGELRWRAAKLAGLKEVPCKIIGNLSPLDRKIRQLVENIHRQDLNSADLAQAASEIYDEFSRSVERQGSRGPRPVQRELAKRIGITEVWLSELLTFQNESSEELKKAVRDGKIGIRDAVKGVRYPDQNDGPEYSEENSITFDEKNRDIKEVYKRKFSEWVKDGEKLKNAGVVPLLDKEILQSIKSQFESSIIPFYQLVKAASEGDEER